MEKVEEATNRLKEQLPHLSIPQLKRLSAELNALFTYYRGELPTTDFHLLFATDTYFGRLTTEILTHFFHANGVQVQPYIPTDLRTSSVEEFEIALTDSVKELSDILEEYRRKRYQIVFNLTGGYKSVNSFLQTMATLWADKSIYIFEGSSELLEIPQLPLKLDQQVFEKHLSLFQKLEAEGELPPAEAAQLPSALVIKIGEKFTLSSWGEMVWQKYKKENRYFYTTPEIYEEIVKTEPIKRILKEKFFENYDNKTEQKGGHYVYDDGNNPYRIFYFKEGGEFYIYKVFTDHNSYIRYLNQQSFTSQFRDQFKQQATLFKL